MKGTSKVTAGERVSGIYQKHMPTKFNDPGMVTVPCRIGTTDFNHAMLDLGAAINVFPYSLCMQLGLGPLNETDILVQLADGSTIRPRGVVENVLVKVDRIFFPMDFYILDMENEKEGIPILLGRPFMRTAGTKVDLGRWTLSLEFD